MGSSLTPVYSSSFTPLDDYHFTVEEINDFRSLPRSGDTTKCDEQIGNQVGERSKLNMFFLPNIGKLLEIEF